MQLFEEPHPKVERTVGEKLHEVFPGATVHDQDDFSRSAAGTIGRLCTFQGIKLQGEYSYALDQIAMGVVAAVEDTKAANAKPVVDDDDEDANAGRTSQDTVASRRATLDGTMGLARTLPQGAGTAIV